MTLTTPGADGPDVRGRQCAWLAVFAPLGIALTVALTLLSGQDWSWPWTLALLPALLGGGAGLALPSRSRCSRPARTRAGRAARSMLIGVGAYAYAARAYLHRARR